MSMKEAHSRIKSEIWKSIAKSEIDLSAVPQDDLEALVELVTSTALIEIDRELGGQTGQNDLPKPGDAVVGGLEEETVLWSGRPFLSLVTEFLITNERIRIISGFLGKDREDVELVRVQDIDQRQTISDRLLKLGDIIVMSHDSSDPKVTLYNIKDPEKVHEILRRAVLNARKRHGMIYREDM